MKIIFFLSLALNFLFATVNLQTQTTKIFDVTQNSATINIPNLSIGQSGVVVTDIDENSIILAQAIITETSNSNSTIEFLDTKVLLQDAIPTTKLRPVDGDSFILNHLYNTSLLIVPNETAKQSVQELYKNQNFLSEDFFAAYLKLINKPVPTKETFLAFAQKQQIGTLFIVVQNNLFIVDSLSFKVLDTILIDNKDNSTNVPFLTKIDQIETGLWSFDEKNINNYDLHYLKMLEIIK